MSAADHIPPRGGALRAGAGRHAIDLDGVLPHDGFTTVADELAARALVIDGSDGRIVLAVIDITSLPVHTLSLVKNAIAWAVDAKKDQVVVVASHTFSAPHVHPDDHPATPAQRRRNEEFERRVVDAAAGAALEAAAQLQSARVETARGACAVAVNRDVETPEGWGLGADIDGPTDSDVSVLAVRTADDAALAVLVNYAVQPSAMNGAQSADGGLLVSGDIAGALSRRIEELVPGSVAFFLPGSGGDQAPAADDDLTSADPRIAVERIAGVLAAEVLRVLPGAVNSSDEGSVRVERTTLTVDGQEAAPRERIRPTRHHRFTAAGPRAVPIAMLRIGDARLLCVQPELSAETGRAIKAASPGAPTFVVTMADGAAKYMPEASAYSRFTYEALSSAYAQGSAEKVVDAAVRLLASEQPVPHRPS